MTMNPLAPWWRPATVLTLLADLIEAELARLGHPLADSPTLALHAETEFGASGLALGSLERLDIATAVSVQFGLHEQGLDHRLLAGRRLGDWVAAVLSARGLDDGCLCFQTSGSTGQPKPCRHAMETLTQEVAHWAEVFAGRRRVLRTVPSHHIYGFLFAVMLPARLGIPVVDVRTELPAGALGRARPGDLLVGHPGFFDLASRAGVSAAADVLAVTSTAPCPDVVWTHLAAAGVQRFIEVYGASETGGIGQREACGSPFRLLPFWSRVAGDDAALLRRLPDGSGSQVCLQDRLRWQSELEFHLAGRVDGAVQVAGVNVFPERVRSLLLEHPAVADARVYISPETAGARLAADVVPVAPDSDALPPSGELAEALSAWLATRLSAAELPRRLRIMVADKASVKHAEDHSRRWR